MIDSNNTGKKRKERASPEIAKGLLGPLGSQCALRGKLTKRKGELFSSAGGRHKKGSSGEPGRRKDEKNGTAGLRSELQNNAIKQSKVPHLGPKKKGGIRGFTKTGRVPSYKFGTK